MDSISECRDGVDGGASARMAGKEEHGSGRGDRHHAVEGALLFLLLLLRTSGNGKKRSANYLVY
jgi:hypothetical protein